CFNKTGTTNHRFADELGAHDFGFERDVVAMVTKFADTFGPNGLVLLRFKLAVLVAHPLALRIKFADAHLKRFAFADRRLGWRLFEDLLAEVPPLLGLKLVASVGVLLDFA